MAKTNVLLHQHVGRNVDFDRFVDAAANLLGKGGIIVCCGYNGNQSYKPLVDSKGRYHRDFTDNGNACYVPGLDVVILNGQELMTAQGEVVAFGMQKGEVVRWKQPIGDTLKELGERGYGSLAPHLFYRDGAGVAFRAKPGLAGRVDTIGVDNKAIIPGIPGGLHPFRANKKAREFYESLKRAEFKVGCSSNLDAHSLFEIERASSGYTPVENVKWTKNGQELVQDLRRKVRAVRDINDLNLSIELWSKLGGAIHAAEIVLR